MDYNKIEQQEKPESAQPSDKNEGRVKATKYEPAEETSDAELVTVPDEPKKSLLSRFMDLFIGSRGVKAAAKQVMNETVKPGLLTLGVDFLENTVETMAESYGMPVNRRRGSYIPTATHQSSSGRTEYNTMYDRQGQAKPQPGFKLASSTPSRFRQFTKPAYVDIDDCNAFFETLSRYKQEKGYISVYDFFSAADWEEDARPTDKNWGWYTLRSFTKRKDRSTGYWVVEVLEEPEQI